MSGFPIGTGHGFPSQTVVSLRLTNSLIWALHSLAVWYALQYQHCKYLAGWLFEFNTYNGRICNLWSWHPPTITPVSCSAIFAKLVLYCFQLGAADLMPGRGTGASLGDRGLRGNLATGRKKRTELICRLFKGPASLLLLSSISKKRGVNKLKAK
jgi:hypothetical protein